jgi:NAD(P)-dependent dehydrogenase (short-subunit alcohol dehydrogenase family)
MPRTAIITGGASGIGAALAAALVGEGADVVLADVDEPGVLRQAAELDVRGPGSARGHALDVRDAAAVTELVQYVKRAHGRVDLMFNNAGIASVGEPDELSAEQWERTLDVNLRGVLHGCLAAFPIMREQGGGHLVNTASIAGLLPCPGAMAAYSTSKFAVVGLSLSLRSAGADMGVRVSALCPGWTDTPLLDGTARAVPHGETVPRSARELLADNGTKLYPADRLAADALRGVARNRALIVAPRSARAAVLVARWAPRLALREALAMTRQLRVGSGAPPPATATPRMPIT